MSGDRLGTVSLRFDAAYCIVLGAVIAAAAGVFALIIQLPLAMVLVAGAATCVWGVAVGWMSARLPLKPALRTVMIANVVAASGIAVYSMLAAGLLVALALIAVAVDVAAFAGSQAVALRRLGPTAN